jgi:hypothetical protein
MMHSLKRILITFLLSPSGIGAASIGGLPGTPRSREEEETIWVDWGGSHLTVPELQQSQEAFKQGAYDRAYESLRRVLESVKVETPAFNAQLLNNLAVSAYKFSQQVDDASRRQMLQNEAKDCITRAAGIQTFSLELSDAVRQNLTITSGRRQHR